MLTLEPDLPRWNLFDAGICLTCDPVRNEYLVEADWLSFARLQARQQTRAAAKFAGANY